MSNKDRAIEIISEMPGNSTIEDIMYNLYVQKKIEDGIDDINTSNLIDHSIVKQELEKWLK